MVGREERNNQNIDNMIETLDEIIGRYRIRIHNRDENETIERTSSINP